MKKKKKLKKYNQFVSYRRVGKEEVTPLAKVCQPSNQSRGSTPRCCTPLYPPSTAENSWRASFIIIWGWY